MDFAHGYRLKIFEITPKWDARIKHIGGRNGIGWERLTDCLIGSKARAKQIYNQNAEC